MKVFISGVISKGGTLSAAVIEANLRRFQTAERLLRAQGHDVFSPPHHVPSNGRPSTDILTWVGYMREDLAALMDCDAILPLPGWEESPGARLEMHVARELGYLVLDPSTFPELA